MRVLFLTLLDFSAFQEKNLYTDILRGFMRNAHEVYCISPVERRAGIQTHFEEDGHLLKLKIGNTQKTNLIEKGLSTLLLERQFISAIRKHFSEIKFDLVLYSTPPVTLAGVVRYVKNRDGAKTYLMLKDIFPQNAVDLGMMATTGLKGLIYRYFRNKERKLYALSDRIGCMSQANVDYLLKHNPEIQADKVCLCPNCIEASDLRLSESERMQMRDRYDLPRDKMIFVYGGNLGKPQDIPYIIKCLKKCESLSDAYFLIAGSGTEKYLLDKYVSEERPTNFKLLDSLPVNEYDRMIACCDVGLIFLDHRFTIPNFPSRLLGYMQAGLPVLASTDIHTDIGKVIVDGGFGWWCSSADCEAFCNFVEKICRDKQLAMSNNSFAYVQKHYSARTVCKQIASSFAQLEGGASE